MGARPRLILLLGLFALVAACGSPPPTAEPAAEPAVDDGSQAAASEPADDPAAADSGARLEEITAELEGLDDDARRQRLIEMAAEEGGEVSFYGSTNIDDIAPVLDAFEDSTDVSVSHYRAKADTILNRVIEEAAAGFVGADVVQMTVSEMPILEDEGHLLPLDTPVREQILESGRFDTWLATHVNAYIAAWNTDRVPEGQRPSTWEDVLQYDGVLSMDVRDFDWFATLVKSYFMEQRGMTEEEAVALFKEAGRNTIFVNGHSIGSQMLVAGEFDLNATMYHHHTTRFPETAPYSWEPAIEPIVVAPSGIGILSSTDRPATALLFTEFVLTDGQPLLAESGRTVGNTSVPGGLSADYETVGISLSTLGEERDKWEALFEEVVRQSGSETIE